MDNYFIRIACAGDEHALAYIVFPTIGGRAMEAC